MLGLDEGVGVGVPDGLGVGVGFATTTFTPLLQTNFFPDLMHVYLYPLTILISFKCVQAAPAFTALEAGVIPVAAKSSPRARRVRNERNDMEK